MTCNVHLSECPFYHNSNKMALFQRNSDFCCSLHGKPPLHRQGVIEEVGSADGDVLA